MPIGCCYSLTGDRIVQNLPSWNEPMSARALLLKVVVVSSCLGLLYALVGCGGGVSPGSGGSGSNGGASASFSLSLSASSLTLSTGGNQSLTVTLVPSNGFSSTAFCNISGVPNGVNANPSSFSLSGGAPQTIQFSLTNSAVSGTSPVTLSCSGSGVSAQAQLSLVAQVTPGLLLTPTPASLSLTLGQTGFVTLGITGVGGLSGTANGTVTGLPAGVTVAQQTFTATVNSPQYLDFTVNSQTAAAGTFPVTVTVTSGSYTASATITLTISTSPDFSVSSGIYTGTGIYQNSSGTLTITTTAYNGFNQPIAVSFSGLPVGVTFVPSTLTIPAGQSGPVKMSASFSAAVNTSGALISVTATGGGITHQTAFNLAILAPTISLGEQPNPISVPAGSTNTFEVGLDGLGNGPQAATIEVGAIPAGVTVSPSEIIVQPGQLNNLNFYVAASSSADSGAVALTATYGPYTSKLSLNINITSAQNDTSVPLTTADQLVPADGLTPYTSFPAPNYLIYHAATNRFFSTDAYLNRLSVVDAATRALKTTLDIPGAFGLDQAPDGSVIYVGTILGDLYEVDPVNLTVLKRIPSASISPYGFQANAAYALANGQLLLVKYFLAPGYSWVDGNGPMALWDPNTNDIHFFQTPGSENGETPSLSTCLQTFENITLTNNRTRVLLTPVLTSEGSSQLCSLDPVADTWNWSGQITGGTNSSLTTLAVSADGNTLAAYDGYAIYNIDPATLAVKNSFTVSTTQTLFAYPAMIVSNNGSQVFLPDSGGADILDVFNLASGTQAGWIPQANVLPPGSYTSMGPMYQATSSTGLAAGVMEGAGIGLLDTTAVNAMPIGSHFGQTQLELATGPTAGGTTTAWWQDDIGVPAAPLGSIYFGSNAATSINGSGFDGTLDAVTPAGQPGPVDVRAFATDGGSQLIPWGFTYGPWVLETTTSYATADGGGPASLFGLGFGSVFGSNGGSYLIPPSDLQVEVGGGSATVDDYLPNPYGSSYFSTPPLPINDLIYTVPPGAAGATTSVSVTTSSGTIAATGELTYLPATQQYPVDGVLADGVYDSKRNLYYFSDVNQIRVFSLANSAWQTPIPIPAPVGAYGPQRLVGLALSPDGSKLAIADPGAIAVYLVNPDQPASVQSFALAAVIGAYPNAQEPLDPVVTNDGMVYYTTINEEGTGGTGLFLLNTNTGALSVPPNAPGTVNYNDPYSRLTLTSDGSRIYFNIEGRVGYFDIASQTAAYAPANNADIEQGTEDFVLAPNQETIFASGLVMDSNLNSLGIQTLDLAEAADATYVFGSAMSADGSLIFQPGDGLVDVLDGRTGSFRARVSVPFTLSPNFRALIPNNMDSDLVAIIGATGNGIAVIDLDSLPEPQPLPYALLVNQKARQSVLAPSAAPLTVGKPAPLASRVALKTRHLPSALTLHRSSPNGAAQTR
jgi:hypothetical protein